MKLSDIMGNMGLAGYTEVAMFIFLSVFLGAVVWVYLPRNRSRFEGALVMPLEDPARCQTETNSNGASPTHPTHAIQD